MSKHVQKPNPRYTRPRGGFTVADEKTLAEFASWWRKDMRLQASEGEIPVMEELCSVLDRDDLTKDSLMSEVRSWGDGDGQKMIHFFEVLRIGVDVGIGEGNIPADPHKTILQDISRVAAPIRRWLDEKDPLRPVN